MSMPRVGSSRIRISGSVISQRASSTFCWLPPERLRISAVGSAGRMSSALRYCSTSLVRVACGIGRSQPRDACSASSMLSATVRSPTTPSALRSSLEKAILRSIACRGLRSLRRSERIDDLAGVGGVGAEEQARELGASGAEQAGEPDHLAVVQLEVGRLERALAAHAERLEHRRPGLVAPVRALTLRSSRSSDLELAADHQLDQLELGGLGDHPLLDQLAVAQDRHPVGDLVDLVEEVRDEDDRDALVAQACASPRTASATSSASRLEVGSSRISTARLDVDGAGDGDQLLDRDRVLAELGGRVDVEAEALEGRPGPAVHRADVDAAEPAGLAAEQHVLGDGEVRAAG